MMVPAAMWLWAARHITQVYSPIADRPALKGGSRWTDDIVVRTQVTTKIVSKHNIGTMLVPYLCKPVLVASELECVQTLLPFIIVVLPTWWQVVLHDFMYLSLDEKG